LPATVWRDALFTDGNMHESSYSDRVAFTLKSALHAPKLRVAEFASEHRCKILALVETAAQSDLCDGQTRILKEIDSPLEAKVDEIGMRRLSHARVKYINSRA
jgi:hypothetical protein